MANVPSPAVVAVLTAPVFWSVSVTVAPGRTPPLESTTLPVTLPWAKAGAASRTASSARRIDPRVRIGASFIVLNQFDELWGVTSCGESIRRDRRESQGSATVVSGGSLRGLQGVEEMLPLRPVARAALPRRPVVDEDRRGVAEA